MRAIVANRFGAADVMELVELPTPEPGTGQLRVAVTAVGVGWLDALIRRGRGPEVFAIHPPYVPGSGMADAVVAVGAGVSLDWLGTSVIAGADGAGSGGGYADTVLAVPAAAFPIPDGLGPHTALALFEDGSTALALLEKTRVRASGQDHHRTLLAAGPRAPDRGHAAHLGRCARVPTG